MTDFSKGFFGVEKIEIKNEDLKVDYVIRPSGEKVMRRVTTNFLWGHQIDPEISEVVGKLSDILKAKAVDTFADLRVEPNPFPGPVAQVDRVDDDGVVHGNG